MITDFGADQAFAQVMDKLVEHYGIVIGESTIRRITEWHAEKMYEKAEQDTGTPVWPQAPGSSAVLIVEMDGGMIPIVEPDASKTDQRKGKKLFWKEAKLCLAHPQGSRTRVYGGTLQGDVDAAGKKLFECARRAGFGRGSHVHALGDGALWIADQVEVQFGAQGSYLLDLYHVCDYLVAAGKSMIPSPAEPGLWLEEQKVRLKTRRSDELIALLQRQLEPSGVADDEAPVRQCHRYLSQRREQLDYQSAIERDLPIGSGEIESAHRYIAQQRLKRPGSWWRAANAEHMLALRINRANSQWHAYWADNSRQARCPDEPHTSL